MCMTHNTSLTNMGWPYSNVWVRVIPSNNSKVFASLDSQIVNKIHRKT